MSILLSVHRQKAGKPMKHDGGWQTKQLMKRLVNGDSYTKSYIHSKQQFTRSLSVIVLYCIWGYLFWLKVSWQKLELLLIISANL